MSYKANDIFLSKNKAQQMFISTFLEGGKFLTVSDQPIFLDFGEYQKNVFFRNILYVNQNEVHGLGPQDLVFLFNPQKQDILYWNRYSAAKIIIVFRNKTEKTDKTENNSNIDGSWDGIGAGAGAGAGAGDEVVDIDPIFDFACDEMLDLKKWENLLENIPKLLNEANQYLKVKNWPFLDNAELSPVLFLDRDGVIIDNVDYIKDPNHINLRSGIVELINRAHQKQYKVVVISNQSGIGRDLFSFKEYDIVTSEMLNILVKQGVYLDMILMASYYEKSHNFSALLHPSLRKPRSGMFINRAKQERWNLSQSIMIGDSACDIQSAFLSGLKKTYIVESDILEQHLQVLKELKKTNKELNFEILKSYDKLIL